jgi:RNA polymerase sigma-70 factor, ECF subfamily
MNEHTKKQVSELVENLCRTESRRVFATSIQLLGDFDLVEEAIHEAFSVAVERWPRDDIPANPRAWLVSVGRFRAIDTIHPRARFDASLADFSQQIDMSDIRAKDDEDVEDDLMRSQSRNQSEDFSKNVLMN